MLRDHVCSLLDTLLGTQSCRDDDWSEIYEDMYRNRRDRAHLPAGWELNPNGLMLAGSRDVSVGLTAVFLSPPVVAAALDAALIGGVMLFAEHSCDFVDDGPGFVGLSENSFQSLEEAGVNVYTAHLPLDLHSHLGPSALIAKALGLGKRVGFAAESRGLPGFAGVVGDAGDRSVATLAAELRPLVGRSSVEMLSGEVAATPAGRTAVVGGGGADPHLLAQAVAQGAITYITGNALTRTRIPFVREQNDNFRILAEANRVAVIDGTHYGTERLAEVEMASVLSRLGLPTTFVEDQAR